MSSSASANGAFSGHGFQMIRSSSSVRKSSSSRRTSSTAGGFAAAAAAGKKHFFGNQKLTSFSTDLQRLQNGGRNTNISDIMKVKDGLLPDIPPLPSNSSDPGAWKVWLAGIFFTVLIPFWQNKWGPLKKLQEKVEDVVDTAQQVTEMVEDVAEGVEKMADQIGDSLPQGSKFQQAAMAIENLANQAVKGTDLIEEVLDKVEAVENQVEDFLDDNKKVVEATKTTKPGSV